MTVSSRSAGALTRLSVSLSLALVALPLHAANDDARTLDTLVVTATAPSSPLHWVTDPRLPLVVAVLSALSLPVATHGAPEVEVATSTSTATLDTVTVTGTRAQGRTVRESAAPIDVLSAWTW